MQAQSFVLSKKYVGEPYVSGSRTFRDFFFERERLSDLLSRRIVVFRYRVNAFACAITLRNDRRRYAGASKTRLAERHFRIYHGGFVAVRYLAFLVAHLRIEAFEAEGTLVDPREKVSDYSFNSVLACTRKIFATKPMLNVQVCTYNEQIRFDYRMCNIHNVLQIFNGCTNLRH